MMTPQGAVGGHGGARMAEVLGEGHPQTSKYREALREMD